MGDRVDVKQHCNFPSDETAKQITCEQMARDCLEQVRRGVRDFTLTRPDGTVEVSHGLDECLSAAKAIPYQYGPVSTFDQSPDCTKVRGGLNLITGVIREKEDGIEMCNELVHHCASVEEWPVEVRYNCNGHNFSHVIGDRFECFQNALWIGSACKSLPEFQWVKGTQETHLDENDVQFYFRIGEGVKFTNASWQSGPTSHYFGDFTELSLHYAPLPMMGLRAVFGRSWLDANDDGAGMHAFHAGLGFDMGSDIRKPFSIRAVGELGMNWFESKDSRFYKGDPLSPDKVRPFDFKRGTRSYAGLELGTLNGALSLNSGYEHVTLNWDREGASYLTPYSAGSWMFGIAFDLAAAGIVNWGEKQGEKAMDKMVK